MEIKISVDCTPQEARTFFGLPDLTPVNDALVEKMKERMEEGFDATSMDNLMQTFMMGATGAGKKVSDIQDMFMSMVGGKSKD